MTQGSGRSRISPGGCQLPRGGANIQFCKIFPKTAWNRKNLGAQGGTHPSCPPRSTTVGGKWKLWFCSVIRCFALGHFWGARGIYPFFHNGWHHFSISIETQKTGDPNFRWVGNWEFCSRMHFWGTRANYSFSVNTLKTMMPCVHLKEYNCWCKFSIGSVFPITMHGEHLSMATLKRFTFLNFILNCNWIVL